MAKVVRNHAPVIIALGAGLVIGAGATVCYYRYLSSVDHQEVLLALEALKRELATLKSLVEEKLGRSSKKKKQPGFYTVHSSSGEEDDDIYEEAYGGTSEFESVRSTSSGEYLSPSESLPEFVGTTEELFQRVDQLLEGTDRDKEEAYKLMQLKHHEHEQDAEFCWRFGKATYFKSQIEGIRGNEENKKNLIYDSVDLTRQAIELDDTLANAHKWYAITTGSTTDYESTNRKIQLGYIFKEHIEKAIEINPNDPSPYYLLGRFCLSAYMLSWWERKAAASLYGEPPSATIDETLENFMKAETLNPGKWKENLLHIAKCHIEKGEYPTAVTWLDKANGLPSKTIDDREAQKEVAGLLSRYGSYRQ